MRTSSSPFLLSIETDAGSYQHGFSLGTDAAVARKFIEEFRQTPKQGTRIVTLGLMQDGQWSSDMDLWLDEVYA